MKINSVNTNQPKNVTSFKSINIIAEGTHSLPTLKLACALPKERDFLITYAKNAESKDKITGISAQAEKATNYVDKLGKRVLNPITIQHIRHMLRRALDDAISPTNKDSLFCELLGKKTVSSLRNLIEKGNPTYDPRQKALLLDFNPDEKVNVVLTRAQLASLNLPQP